MTDKPIYEEVSVKCVGCSKKIKVMRISGSNDDSYLCNKCGGMGGSGVNDDMDD